jgi:CRP-like cAMP-binding protein
MSLDRSLLSDLAPFKGLKPEDLDGIVGDAQSVRVPKGQAIFSQDDDARSFFVLLHGRLRVVKLTPSGQQVVVRFVSPGEIFGVAMALGRTTYPATATAVVDSIALAWPSAIWPRLVAKHPSIAVNTLQTVHAGRKVAEGVEIDFPISRQDIAEMTGTTLHTVSRILSAWEEQGLVNGGRQRIVLREPHKLMVLAERAPE